MSVSSASPSTVASSTPASSSTPHSRIPIASYRLRTPTSTSSRSSGISSPKYDHKLESLPSTAAPWVIHSSPTALQTAPDRGIDRDQTHQRTSVVSSLHSYGHSLSIYSTTSPAIVSTALDAPLTPTPRHQSHHHQASASIASIYSARSTDALKSPVSIDRTSTDAIKSPLASSLHTLGALKHRRQLSRTPSVNSVESARTKRISSPIFQEASSGIYPTAEEREEQQRRASMEHQEPSSPDGHFNQTNDLSLYGGMVSPRTTRQRLLSTAHEVDDEQDGHDVVAVPAAIVISNDNTAGADVCVKTPTHTSKSADATFQSRFSHSPGPGRGLKETKTRPDWLLNPPSLPLLGSIPILRKSFSDAQRPSIGALEREAARCPSPAFSLHASRHRKLVQALRHPKTLKKDKDASPRQKDENELIQQDTAASIHSSGLPSRNSQQTFTSVERRPSSRTGGLVRAIHRTGRTLRERLGSKPPGTPHCAQRLEVEPAVPPRAGRLSLDKPVWLTQSATNSAAQDILADRTSQQPATPKHDDPKQGASAFVSPLATFGKEQSFRNGSIGSTLRRRPRLLSKTRRRSRQTSTNAQPSANCDPPHQRPAAPPIQSGAAPMLDSSIRESWIDISTDVQQEGFTAVNGQGRKQKQSWYLAWKRSRQKEKQPQRGTPSTAGPIWFTGPPPSLPLVPSGQAFFRGASILFGSDAGGADAPPPDCRDPGQQQKVAAPATSTKPPPHKSLLLPALQEVELKTRPVVALPQRARSALKSEISTFAATAPSAKPVGSSEPTLKPLLMSVASLPSRPALGELPSLPRSQTAQQRPAKTTSPSLPVVKEPCRSPKKQRPVAPPARSPSLLRNTDSLPVPPRRLSRARISSEEELKPSVSASERDLTKTSVRSATTISSSILFSDVEMALNRLLDEQPEGKDAPKKSTPVDDNVGRAAQMGATSALPGLDDWIDEDDCDSSRANQTFYHETMASAEKRLADALVRYLQASRSPDRSPQAHRALRDVLNFAKVLSPVSHSSDIGDVTAITDKLRNLVTQFRNTPASTPSRRYAVASSTHTSQHHLRTPEHRRTVGGSPMRKSGGSPAGMLTPEKWRQDERRRHSRKRSSAVASSIGHSVMSYCSTAMSSSAEDVTSLLETLMDGPNEQIGGEALATPASTRKRKESESDGIGSSQRLSWTVDLPRMTMLQESHIVFGMPHAERMSSATDASADTSGQCGPNEDDATLLIPPLQSILRFYESQNPDWHGEAVPKEARLKPNSPNSKRRAVEEEDGTSKATPVPVQGFDGSPRRIPAKPNLRSQRRHLATSQSTTPGSPHRRVRGGTPSSPSVRVSPDRRSPRIAPTTSPSARASEASTSRSPIIGSGGFQASQQRGGAVGQEKHKRDSQATLTKERDLTAPESAIRKSSLSSAELAVTARATRSQTRRVTGSSQNSDLFGSPVDSKASASRAAVSSIPSRGVTGAAKRLSRSKPNTSNASVLLSPPPAVVVTDADVEAKFQSLAAIHGSERNASASSLKQSRTQDNSIPSPAVALKTLPQAGSPFKSVAADRSD